MDIFNEHDRLIGKFIGNYKIIERVGDGNIGVVFRAEDSAANIERAIKIIPQKEIDSRPNWAQEINKPNEIQSVGGVVQYITHGNCTLEGEDFVYIVWQYINSESLKSVIEAGNITIQILIDVIECALNVFEACKQTGIQHSDFHSGNILVEFPNKLGLYNNKRNIWVTDFGYGTFSNNKPPLEDYKGLAKVIQDALSVDKSYFHSLEGEDKVKFSALKNVFPKLLLEENRLEGDHVGEPRVLWSKLQELFQVHEQDDNSQKSVGDYLAAEFIGDRYDEWKSLFVPKFLCTDELLDRNICVLTGLRGCGKTMMFKRLSTQLVRKLGSTGVAKEDTFICFYLNARNLAEAFPWLPDTEENIARNQVINFFHLKWTIEILEWLRNEIGNSYHKTNEVDWLINFFNRFFREQPLYCTSTTPKGIINDIIYRCNEEISKSKLSGNFLPSIPWPFSDIDYLEKILGTISRNTQFSKDKSFYMLLDDYSTPLVTESTQRILNSVIFRRCAEVFFKISTESTESLLRVGLNGKPLEDGADFKLIDLGIVAINCDIQEKRDTISAIFEKRIERYNLFEEKGLSLKRILGENDLSEVKRALKIRENDKQVIYYGFDVFCDMWSSDLRELIKIFSKMISEEGEDKIQKNLASNNISIISRDVQNKVLRETGGRFLHALSIVTNPFKKRSVSTGKQTDHDYGKKLYEIVTAFQEIAYSVLKYRNVKNQTSNPPKQARKIELTTAVDKLDAEGLELYNGLIRYGVFIRDYRGKSVRGSAAVRLYLRSLLIPYCRLTFSKKENISFEWKYFNKFLRNPEAFKKEYIKKITSQLKKEELQNQQNELFDSKGEILYVTTDDIE
jgi:serine/threonine protein kinase